MLRTTTTAQMSIATAITIRHGGAIRSDPSGAAAVAAPITATLLGVETQT